MDSSIRRTALALLTLLICSITPNASAQQIGDVDNVLPPFGAYGGSDFDLVSIQNGNLHIRIPVLDVKQRGGNFSVNFVYDTPTFAKTVTVITSAGHRVTATELREENGQWRVRALKQL